MTVIGKASRNMSRNCSIYSHHDYHYDNFKVAVSTVYTYLGGFIIGFGLIGNILTLLVLRKERPSTTTLLLMCLAVGDFLYLMLNSLIHLGTFVSIAYYEEKGGIMDVMNDLVKPLGRIIQTFSVWVTIFLTIERYFAINRPFTAKIIFSLRRAKLAVFLVAVLSIVVHSPSFFEMKLGYRMSRFACKRIWRAIPTSLYYNEIYFITSRVVLDGLVRLVIPSIILIVMNYQLIRGLQSSLTMRAQYLDNSKIFREAQHFNNMVALVIVVVVVHLICNSPYLIFTILDSTTHKLTNQRNFMSRGIRLHMKLVIELLITLNASINFVLYFLTGKRFRSAVLEKLDCRKKRTARRSRRPARTRRERAF